MNDKLQKKLFKKYPKIFAQKSLPMSRTCMCWGIDTGDGWFWLIDNLCSSIQDYIDNNNCKIPRGTNQGDLGANYTVTYDSSSVGELNESKTMNENDLVDSIPQVEAVQVKEKYGGLRFYYDGGNETIHGMVWLAERMSRNICEYCGSNDRVKQTSGWITSLCTKCFSERKRKEKRNEIERKCKENGKRPS